MKLLILSVAFFATSLSSKTATVSTVSTNDTTMSFPCHPNGDLYPCTHPSHPNGDIGPCNHFDAWGNRIHTADLYPCTHPAHSLGDLGPCTHVCW